MATFKQSQWPAGWLPSNNWQNGNTNGLALAVNITQDEHGVVRQRKGTRKVSSGPFTGLNGEAIFSSVFDLYTLIDSSYPNRARVRYVGLSNGTVVRNYDSTNKSEDDFGISVLSGGNTRFAFGSCFGHTLMFSGSQKRKDRGDLQHDLGIPAPSTPGVSANTPPTVKADDRNGSNFYNNWDAAAIEGSGYSYSGIDYIACTTAALDNYFRGIVQRGVSVTTTLDLNTLSVGTGTDEDLFAFNLRVAQSEHFIKIRVEYLLESPTGASTTPDVKNYYWHEWTNRVNSTIEPNVTAPDMIPLDATQDQINAWQAANPGVSFVPSIREGANVWSALQCKRGSFARVGDDDSKNWSTVKGIRVSVYSVEAMQFLINEFRFIGGTQGQLTGNFYYIQQDFRDTRSYVEFGLPSTPSGEIVTFGSSNQITPTSINTQANGFRIYRLSNATDGFYPVLERTKQRISSAVAGSPTTFNTTVPHGLSTGNSVAIRDGVNAWAGATGTYSITVTGPSQFTVPLNSSGFGTLLGDIGFVNLTAFADYISDAEAMGGGEITRLDRNKALLPDDIYGMVGPYYERAIYITPTVIIPSEQGDPSRYDTRYTLELAADTGEVALFIAKVAEGVIMIGTTADVYILQGDLTVDSFGVMNARLTGLGLKQPPISSAFTVINSELVYLAMDGWRSISGSTNGLISDELRLMFPPVSESRLAYGPFRILPADGVKTSVVAVGNKLYFAMEYETLGRTVVILDTRNGRWEQHRDITAANNPYVFFVEQDGVILFTTESAGDNYLHQYEYGTKIDGVTNIFTQLVTFYYDFDAPQNRKDALTLIVDADTGGSEVRVRVGCLRDDNTITTVDHYYTFNGRTVRAFDLSSLPPAKRYYISMQNELAGFVLYGFEFSYDLRPTQLNFLRIPPNNWGVAGRKRVPEIPLLIDTLGNTVTFTPILDNTTKTGVNFVKTDKDVFHHVFNEEQAAYVIGGTLQTVTPGGVFEFYDLITPREIEVLPDPLSYKHIPYTNLGSGARKRFIQFAFIIDTRGNDVTFTPYVDGVSFASQVYNTTRRQTVVYTFVTEALGIDVGGILDSVVADAKFEYYGVDLNESITEKLPPAARFVRVPCDNFGTAGKKRVRTIPLSIDTRGGTVTFTPYVDGVAQAPSTHVTNGKQTVFHYFTNDVFGVDYCGTLTSPTDFEFYGMLKPEVVEVLPVGKKYDQVGPLELKRMGRIYKARVRVVPTGLSMTYDLIIDGASAATGTWLTTPNVEQVLEITFEKFVMGVVARLELSSNDVFHRLYSELLIRFSGNDTNNNWVKLA